MYGDRKTAKDRVEPSTKKLAMTKAIHAKKEGKNKDELGKKNKVVGSIFGLNK